MGFLFVKTADGKKKPSVWVFLFILLLVLGGSIFFVVGDRVTGFDKVMNTDKASAAEEVGENAPPAMTTEQSELGGDGLDAEAENAMRIQIEREKSENNGWISQDRIKEIKEKFQTETEQRTNSNFQPTVADRLQDFEDAPPPTPPVLPDNIEKVDKPQKFMTLTERLAAEGIDGGSSGGESSSEFGVPEKIEKQQTDAENLRKGMPPSLNGKNEKMKNLLPLGTFIPCVLESDVITTDLNSTVWAMVVLDVTFRRQLQLPKGLVKLRGKTGSEPVQNMVDIFFDVMVFSDGTELPIAGFAYAAFDPRFPNRFKVRGVPGEMIVPPLFVKLQGLVYSAALGASDAYIQNYANENTTIPNTFTTVPTINPVTGQVENVIQQQQGLPVNNNIGGTVALSAGQAALSEWVQEAKNDLEKYRPYVVVEKGTPIFVQLEETINVSDRKVNGVAIAQAEAMANGGVRMGGVPSTGTYAPGDARSKYTGSADTGTPGVSGDIAKASNDFLKQLQNVGPSDTSSLQQAQQTLQRAQQSSGQNPADLQQILQQMGGN